MIDSIKKWIKSNPSFLKMYSRVEDIPYKAATIISPKLNTTLRFRQANGFFPNYAFPKTLTEKLVWLKLNMYMEDPLVIQCADKFRVRDYVESKGCSDTLNDLIGVYDSADQIPWDSLPNKFVLKWNFGAGMNLICTDKTKLDIDGTIKKLNKWGKSKYWLNHSEMQYKYTPKKIICEKFLENKRDEVIPDYKVYCFHGEPLAIFVMHDRGKGVKSEFFDINWNLLQNTKKYQNPAEQTPKPKCLDRMIEVSRLLSEPFPFVRCDFYVVNDILVFGEMTFTPAGGVLTSQTQIAGKEMGDYLHIEDLVKRQ